MTAAAFLSGFLFVMQQRAFGTLLITLCPTLNSPGAMMIDLPPNFTIYVSVIFSLYEFVASSMSNLASASLESA